MSGQAALRLILMQSKLITHAKNGHGQMMTLAPALCLGQVTQYLVIP
jgi:hypothetical protein